MQLPEIKIRKGLNLPISGAPRHLITDVKRPLELALLGTDYPGVKPRFAISVGDYVKLGQLLFNDKKMQSVQNTSPGKSLQ